MAGVYTVTQINTYIKNMFARDYALSNVTIEGEVSNCKYHTRGHIYFTLKDANSAISCVMFGSRAELLAFRLKDGQKLEARGQIMVYEKSGSYQLYVNNIKLSGQGELYERFLRLRQELLEMGMFDPAYKKPIPAYVQRIGIVTSPTGAVIRDICQVSFRRNPYVELILYPAMVQGEAAKESIVKGIETLDEMGLDVIIIGRGGGSIEDLWAFNEEVVARAIFDANTPIISAVGHETDFTISDYVADLRAPTPSAAAELANFEYAAFIEELEAIKTSLYTCMRARLDGKHKQLLDKRLKLNEHDPKLELEKRRQQIGRFIESAGGSINEKIKNNLYILESRYDRLRLAMDGRLTDSRHQLAVLAGMLDGQSPLKKLSNGYGYITDTAGAAVSSVDGLKPGDEIVTRIKDGRISSRVISADKSDYQLS